MAERKGKVSMKRQVNRIVKINMAWIIGILLMAISVTEVRADEAYDSIAGKEEWEIVRIVNEERYRAGREGISIFGKIQSAAGIRAKELPELFAHQRPDGTSCFTVLTDKNISYRAAGENIAAGQTSPSDVMNSWMNSPGHKSNILSESFDHIGVGYATGGFYGKNWVQLFVGGCQTTSVRVNDINDASYTKGTSIDDMQRYLIVTCSEHGTSYVPVISAMCGGYNPNKTGRQTIKVTYHDLQTSFTVTIKGDGETAAKPGKVKKLTLKRTGSYGIRVSFQKTDCDGYEVFMKTGKGKFKKVKTLTRNAATSCTIKSLKQNKSYTFKVRAYRKDGDSRIYGAYSASKKMKL